MFNYLFFHCLINLVIHQPAVEFPYQVPGGLLLAENHINQRLVLFCLLVGYAGFAKGIGENLRCFVVSGGIIIRDIGGPVHQPSGQYLGSFADICLCIVGIVAIGHQRTFPDGKEFEQLAAVILIRGARLVGFAIEVDQHGRIDRHFIDQLFHIPQCILAQQLLVLVIERRIIDPRGLRYQVIVPEKRHFIHQRAVLLHHLTDPPAAQAPHPIGIESAVVCRVNPGLTQGNICISHIVTDRWIWNWHLLSQGRERSCNTFANQRIHLTLLCPEHASVKQVTGTSVIQIVCDWLNRVGFSG